MNQEGRDPSSNQVHVSRNCTLYQKIFLKSVLGVFRRKGVEEAVFKEVYEVFSSLCQFQGIFSTKRSHLFTDF